VLVLVNPKAGRGPLAAGIERLGELVRAQHRAVEISSDLDAICQEANETYREGRLRALVSVGGDGTAAELVNRTDPGLPICVYPSGTANLLPRYLGLRSDPLLISKVIDDGFQIKLDAGIANGRVLLVNASCGFDADVVRQVHRRREETRSGHLSYWSYLKPIIRAIRSYQYPEIRVELDSAPTDPCSSRPDPWVVRWVFAFNLPLYGWGLPLAPWADGTDGLLDVCTFQGGFFWNGLRYLVAAQGGWHRRLHDCRIGQATRLRISAEQPVAYQLDGDPGGWLPLEIEILPQRLTFVVPKGNQRRA
jgi:diacylglycerol kinase family enzyme